MKLLGLFLFTSCLLLGESYTYHPSNGLYLAAGFDPAYPERAFQSCIRYDGRQNVDGKGAIKTEYSLSMVKSKKELFDRLSVSASLSARSLFWSANAGVDYFSQHRFHSDSITWMLTGKSEYGRHIIQNAQLSPSAAELIKNRSFEQFAKQCGTEFIKQERRSVLVAAIFSVENVSQEEIKRLETHFQASASAVFFEANAQTRYSRFISEASRINRINLSIYAIGGSGITELSSLVISTDDLGQVQQAISKYMSSLTEDKAVPSEYLSGSMAAFGWNGSNPAQIFKRERTLSELYYRYKEIQGTHERLGQILNHKNNTAYEGLSNAQWQAYQTQYNEHADYLTTLINAADLCHDSFGNCQVPKNTLSRVIWPINTLSPCEKMRFQAHQAQLIDDFELEDLRTLNLAPIINPKNKRIGAYQFCSGTP